MPNPNKLLVEPLIRQAVSPNCHHNCRAATLLSLVFGFAVFLCSRLCTFGVGGLHLKTQDLVIDVDADAENVAANNSDGLSLDGLSLDLKRPRADGLTLDPKLCAECPDLVIAHLEARRHNDMDGVRASVARIGEAYNKMVEQTSIRMSARSRHKDLSKQFGKLRKGQGEPGLSEDQLRNDLQIAMNASNEADKAQSEARLLCESLMKPFPNLLADITPDGENESENPVIYEWGSEHRLIGDGYKWHDVIAFGLAGWDSEAAERISGARLSVLKGGVSALERALASFFLDKHVFDHGYTEVSVPYIIGRTALEGTGQLPKFEKELFKISHKCNEDDAFLIPTAEVPVTNIYAGKTLDECDLPIKLCCQSACFRAEAGAHADTRGYIRQHQFQKVELVKIVKREDSSREHEQLTKDAEAILQALKLPYRKVRLCSGDIGLAAAHCYDLEVWLPGQQAYREISSCSNMFDYQARRMGLTYRPKEFHSAKSGDRPTNRHCHTMNGSGLAVGRALVAVLENYQQPDGSVIIPEVLRPYMRGFGDVLRPVRLKDGRYR